MTFIEDHIGYHISNWISNRLVYGRYDWKCYKDCTPDTNQAAALKIAVCNCLVRSHRCVQFGVIRINRRRPLEKINPRIFHKHPITICYLFNSNLMYADCVTVGREITNGLPQGSVNGSLIWSMTCDEQFTLKQWGSIPGI